MVQQVAELTANVTRIKKFCAEPASRSSAQNRRLLLIPAELHTHVRGAIRHCRYMKVARAFGIRSLGLGARGSLPAATKQWQQRQR